MGIELQQQAHELASGRPDSPLKEEIYRARLLQFQANVAGNMSRAMVGGMIVAGVLFFFRTDSDWLLGWSGLLVSAVLLVLYLNNRIDLAQVSLAETRRWLMARYLSGWLVAAVFGVTPFLLPASADNVAVFFLVAVLLMVAVIAALTYAMFPLYYLGFDAAVMLPLIGFLLLNLNDVMGVALLTVLMGQVMFLSKALQISRLTVSSIATNILLRREVEEHKKANRRIRHLAFHDGLTGLANRSLFGEQAKRSVRLSQREGTRSGFIFFDVDCFKSINDRFGHAAGDAVLVRLAQSLSDNIRQSDTAARLGGDEFCILLEGIESAEDARRIADKVRADMARSGELSERFGEGVSVSYGHAIYPNDGEDVESLMRVADQRMYAEKQQRKLHRPAVSKPG